MQALATCELVAHPQARPLLPAQALPSSAAFITAASFPVSGIAVNLDAIPLIAPAAAVGDDDSDGSSPHGSALPSASPSRSQQQCTLFEPEAQQKVAAAAAAVAAAPTPAPAQAPAFHNKVQRPTPHAGAMAEHRQDVSTAQQSAVSQQPQVLAASQRVMAKPAAASRFQAPLPPSDSDSEGSLPQIDSGSDGSDGDSEE